jgi:hypothetical protein
MGFFILTGGGIYSFAMGKANTGLKVVTYIVTNPTL